MKHGRRIRSALSGLALLALLIFAAEWYGAHLLAPVSHSGALVTVDIPPGATAETAARRLKRAGLIRSTLVFGWMARFLGQAHSMKSGEYRIARNLGVREILQQLVDGKAEFRLLLIPEGWTLTQVADAAAMGKVAASRELIRDARQAPRQFGLDVPVFRHSLEGYLMPDTYRFPANIRERDILKTMVADWRRKIWEPYRDLFAASDLPPDKIVIIASMIEREAKVPGDRALISSVVRNRLKRKMRLQIDATVLYALNKRGVGPTLRDLKVDSPFNTYRRLGLPPAPICNPGKASILAALQPADTDYLFYVARPDGSHVFTRTSEEHLKAVSRMRVLRQQAAAASGPATIP